MRMAATAYVSGQPTSLAAYPPLRDPQSFLLTKSPWQHKRLQQQQLLLRFFPRGKSGRSQYLSYPNGARLRCGRRTKLSIGGRPLISPVMEWQDCRSEIEVDVPCSVAYQCYSDREMIPQWMPFISSVKILPDQPELSRWTLKYEFLGRDFEFSWLARNLKPIPNQKIHWRSLEGLPNRGAVRFFPKGPSSCRVQLTFSYEVPEILAPAASLLKPFMEGLIFSGLQRFASVAREYKTTSS